MSNNKKISSRKRGLLMKKVAVAVIFLFLINLSAAGTAIGAKEPELAKGSVFIDNQPTKTEYLLQDGHLLVPALFFKHTGVLVDESNKYHSIIFRSGNVKFAIPIGKSYADHYVGTKAWKRSNLSTKTIEKNGKVFVPLVDVGKKLDMEVTYNSKTSQTFVTTNIPKPPKGISKGSSDKKLVALTFDDGPDDYFTPKILDILKKKDVKATFFVMGKHVTEFPDMMKRIVKEGHAIGNHTQNHPLLPNKMSADVYQEIASTQTALEKTVGLKPDIFRPPYGAITKTDAWILHKMGLRAITWSVDSEDWEGKTAEEIVTTVNREISPGGIILQHNFPSKDRQILAGSVKSLPDIIDDLREKGYQFVTVQTLLDQG
ncbi:polysaccharide deacetylase family protein [Bacillus piscicola]|uniref:polysaccharide deacetylase family protein n=1 Tax=Bacillus piscicola TaxID=1632684 RepID=UPI001F09386F|nr:polysaccharide deacetylase family protein [Bacillus piscicola]